MRLYFIFIVVKLINQVISDSLNCDFNSNDCTWYPLEPTTSITWRWTGQLSDNNHGGHLEVPIKGPNIGKYLSSSTNQDEHLISGSIRNLWYIPRSGCFSFSYRFYFLERGWLNLTLRPISGDPVLLYSTKESRSLDWSRVSVDLGNSPEFYLIFSFSLELINSNNWLISLDDFTFSRDKQCSDFTLCNFETGSCHWKLSGWQRVTAGQSSIPTDHSTLTSSGHFIEPKVFGSQSSLSLVPLSSTTKGRKGCLAFWTFVDLKQDMPQLFVRQSSGDRWKVDLERLKLSSITNQSWQYNQMTVSLQHSTFIETIASSSSQLAIDDLILSEEPCPTTGTCDFSYDSCGWFNSGQSPWLRQIGLLPSLSSSPTISKLFDSHQWYIISDTKGGQAIFESSPMTIETFICFSFSYFYTCSNTENCDHNLVINLNQIDGKVITLIDKIPLEFESQFNWNYFERTVNVQSKGQFSILLILSQENQSTAFLIDDIKVSYDKCSNESPKFTTRTPTISQPIETTVDPISTIQSTDQLIVTNSPTSTTTIETDCCVLEPCICVNPETSTNYETTSSISEFTIQSITPTISQSIGTTFDSMSSTLNNQETTTTIVLTSTITSTTLDDLATDLITDPTTTTTTTTQSTDHIQTEIDSSSLTPTITINSLITESVTNQLTTSIKTTTTELLEITETPLQSTTTINYNQETSSTPIDEINKSSVDLITPVTSSIDLISTVNFDQSTVDQRPVTVENVESITTESIDLIFTLKPEELTINSTIEEKLNSGHFGNNLISIVNIIFDERPLIASISGLTGLVLLVIGLIVLAFNWKQSSPQPRNQHLIVAPEDMELQTFTFTRRTDNSQLLEIMSQSDGQFKS